MPLNSPGGSTLQCCAAWTLLCLAQWHCSLLFLLWRCVVKVCVMSVKSFWQCCSLNSRIALLTVRLCCSAVVCSFIVWRFHNDVLWGVQSSTQHVRSQGRAVAEYGSCGCKTRKAIREQCLRLASKPAFGLVRPWPLTFYVWVVVSQWRFTVIITTMIFINSAALSKIRRAAGTCHSVLTKRCTFRRRAKVAVNSVDRRSSAGKLFQVSGPETAKFLRPMAVAVCCTSSLPEAADLGCRRPV